MNLSKKDVTRKRKSDEITKAFKELLVHLISHSSVSLDIFHTYFKKTKQNSPWDII